MKYLVDICRRLLRRPSGLLAVTAPTRQAGATETAKCRAGERKDVLPPHLASPPQGGEEKEKGPLPEGRGVKTGAPPPARAGLPNLVPYMTVAVPEVIKA